MVDQISAPGTNGKDSNSGFGKEIRPQSQRRSLHIKQLDCASACVSVDRGVCAERGVTGQLGQRQREKRGIAQRSVQCEHSRSLLLNESYTSKNTQMA